LPGWAISPQGETMVNGVQMERSTEQIDAQPILRLLSKASSINIGVDSSFDGSWI